MRNSRHIRWNWGISPDNPSFVRYHLIVVDDKDRRGTMNQLLDQLQKFGGALELIRTQKGRVKDGKLRYLFQTYDSRTAPRMLTLNKIGKPAVQDLRLKERVRGSVEDYVRRLYEV